ncbi:hypothetical protein BHE74_00025523 [Ensete ventricosum]|nr:hypothetical protein GW17_00048117 [Ensete ventricosum]RWW67062.1 hypothetical protein BHE74_00025523 [Ensete ventricosum]RZS27870.1 hypothetical protein BHM03_00061405 [Ensete ventricosum]
MAFRRCDSEERGAAFGGSDEGNGVRRRERFFFAIAGACRGAGSRDGLWRNYSMRWGTNNSSEGVRTNPTRLEAGHSKKTNLEAAKAEHPLHNRVIGLSDLLCSDK